MVFQVVLGVFHGVLVMFQLFFDCSLRVFGWWFLSPVDGLLDIKRGRLAGSASSSLVPDKASRPGVLLMSMTQCFWMQSSIKKL